MKTRTEILDEASRAFEESNFYFCGESPTERIMHWRIWIAAWTAALNSVEENNGIQT